jgi:SAM-dependent methyltransferase
MTRSDPPRATTNPAAALAQYRRRAPHYDLELAVFEPIRREAIARLALRPGEGVLDIGCGTGLSLAQLRHGVGTRGRIVGIEQSPEMMALARQRVRQHGWRNVALIEAPADVADIAGAAPMPADAALFHFTHDILRDPRALANVAGSLKPGARVVACGLKWATPWAWPLNLFVLGAARHSVSSLAGLDRPWSLLAEHLADLRVDTKLGGAVFLMSGTMRTGRQPHAH